MPSETDGRYEHGQTLSPAENDRLMEVMCDLPALADPQLRQLVWDELRKELGPLRQGDAVIDMWELHRYIHELAQRLNLVSQRVSRKSIRMGFMVDIVGYGQRDSPAKESLQRRLADLLRIVLAEIDVAMSNTEIQGTGDGMLVILPERLDIQRGLIVLLRYLEERLVYNNNVFRDRMRVRVATDVGPVSPTDLGFGGAMVTKLGRMLDSRRLRRFVNEHPERDLVAILSDAMHEFVVAEGVLGLPRNQFTRVRIRAKELVMTAWVWAQ